MTSAPSVAYVMGTYLAFTETFLYDQMRALCRYRAIVLCGRIANEQRFPWHGARALGTEQPEPALRTLRVLHRFARLDPTWRAAIAEHRVTVLHGQYGTSGQLAAVYARQLGLPLVTSFYGGDVSYLASPRTHLRTHWHYVLGKRALFSATDTVLALSRDMRDELVRLGCPADKIRIHHNGADLTRFHPTERGATDGARPVLVLMCGRAVEKKGFEHGMRAVRLARDRGAPLRLLWLTAPGPLQSRLARLVDELGLRDHVEALEPQSDVAEAMARADVILSPSVRAADGDKEGVPTVLVEAAASGLPQVATRHAGIPEIVIDGRTGFLFPERDVEGLADGLVRLASDRELRLRMGREARRVAEEEFDARRLAARLEQHYDELRTRAGAGRPGARVRESDAPGC